MNRKEFFRARDCFRSRPVSLDQRVVLKPRLLNTMPPLRRNADALIAALTLLIVLIFIGCKKSKEEPKEMPPVFGSCQSVPPVGGLTETSVPGAFIFRTNGGGTIHIDPDAIISIKHDDYSNFKLEFWGDTGENGQHKTSANHENLNGKHIKDRSGVRRSILFPDGAKITFVAESEYGPLVSIRIYDGEQSHHINPKCNKIEHSAISSSTASRLDSEEADGETSTFEITESGLIYKTIYREDNVGDKKTEEQKLGELDRDNVNQVNDYFDDPRLQHT